MPASTRIPALPLRTQLWRYWSFTWLIEPVTGDLDNMTDAVLGNRSRLRRWLPTYLQRHSALLAVLACCTSLLRDEPVLALVPAVFTAVEATLLVVMGLQSAFLHFSED